MPEAPASHNNALHLPLHIFPRMPSVLHRLALTLFCSDAHVALPKLVLHQNGRGSRDESST